MNILFLDDSQARRSAFDEKYPGAVMVSSNHQAIEELQKCDYWHIIFLDYDLDGGANSYETARWIRDHIPGRPEQWHGTGFDVRRIVIHSTNILGSMDLLELLGGLRPCLYVPFDYETWIKP